MEKDFREGGISVDAKREANDMKVCIDCLDRLIEDDYELDAFKEHDEKWGELSMGFEPHEGSEEWSRCVLTRPNINNEEDAKQENLEFMVCMNKADIDKKEDIKKLFNNMRQRIEWWWD